MENLYNYQMLACHFVNLNVGVVHGTIVDPIVEENIVVDIV